MVSDIWNLACWLRDEWNVLDLAWYGGEFGLRHLHKLTLLLHDVNMKSCYSLTASLHSHLHSPNVVRLQAYEVHTDVLP